MNRQKTKKNENEIVNQKFCFEVFWGFLNEIFDSENFPISHLIIKNIKKKFLIKLR